MNQSPSPAVAAAGTPTFPIVRKKFFVFLCFPVASNHRVGRYPLYTFANCVGLRCGFQKNPVKILILSGRDLSQFFPISIQYFGWVRSWGLAIVALVLATARGIIPPSRDTKLVAVNLMPLKTFRSRLRSFFSFLFLLFFSFLLLFSASFSAVAFASFSIFANSFSSSLCSSSHFFFRFSISSSSVFFLSFSRSFLTFSSIFFLCASSVLPHLFLSASVYQLSVYPASLSHTSPNISSISFWALSQMTCSSSRLWSGALLSFTIFIASS